MSRKTKNTADLPVKATTSTRQPSAEEVALSKDGILKAAGSWKDVDADAFKTYIASRRRGIRRPSVHL